MAGIFQGLLGAGLGLITGGIPGSVAGGIGGLIGGGTHEDPIQKQARLRQQGMANQLLGYANSVPGSSSDELANLSQNRALLGEQQRQQQNRVMGAWTPDQGTSATGLLQNITNSQIGQQQAARSSYLMDAAANRRQALLQASGLNQQAAGMYQPQQSQLSQLLGQLSQSLAYRQTQQQLMRNGGQGTTASPELQAELARLGIKIPGAPPTAFPHDWWSSGTANNTAGSLTPWNQGRMTPMGGMGDDPSMTALLMGMQPQPGPGMQGAMAPGNEPGGMNAVNNAARQSNGLGGRSLVLPDGTRLPY